MFQVLPCDLVRRTLEDFVGLSCVQASVLDVAFCGRQIRADFLLILSRLVLLDGRPRAGASLVGFLAWIAKRNIQVSELCVHPEITEATVTELRSNRCAYRLERIRALQFVNDLPRSQTHFMEDAYIGMFVSLFPALTSVDCRLWRFQADCQLLLFCNLKLSRLVLQETPFAKSAAICLVVSTMCETLQELDMDGCVVDLLNKFDCPQLRRLRLSCHSIHDLSMSIENMCLKLGGQLEELCLRESFVNDATIRKIAQSCPLLRILSAEYDDVHSADTWNCILASCPRLLKVGLHKRRTEGFVELSFTEKSSRHGRRQCSIYWAHNNDMESPSYETLQKLNVTSVKCFVAPRYCTISVLDTLGLLADKLGADLEKFECHLDDEKESLEQNILYFLSRCPNLLELKLDCEHCRSFTDVCLLAIPDCCPKLKSLALISAKNVSEGGLVVMREKVKVAHETTGWQ